MCSFSSLQMVMSTITCASDSKGATTKSMLALRSSSNTRVRMAGVIETDWEGTRVSGQHELNRGVKQLHLVLPFEKTARQHSWLFVVLDPASAVPAPSTHGHADGSSSIRPDAWHLCWPTFQPHCSEPSIHSMLDNIRLVQRTLSGSRWPSNTSCTLWMPHAFSSATLRSMYLIYASVGRPVARSKAHP